MVPITGTFGVQVLLRTPGLISKQAGRSRNVCRYSLMTVFANYLWKNSTYLFLLYLEINVLTSVYPSKWWDVGWGVVFSLHFFWLCSLLFLFQRNHRAKESYLDEVFCFSLIFHPIQTTYTLSLPEKISFGTHAFITPTEGHNPKAASLS
jgi:hypothetical protein